MLSLKEITEKTNYDLVKQINREGKKQRLRQIAIRNELRDMRFSEQSFFSDMAAGWVNSCPVA